MDTPLPEIQNALQNMQVEEPKKKVDLTGFKRFIANFLIPLIALAIMGILVLVVIMPAVREIPVLQSDLAEREVKVASLDEKLQKLRSLTDFKESVEENHTLVSKVLAEEPLVPQLLTQIDRIAGESGVTLTKINYTTAEKTLTPEEEKAKPPYNIVAINVGSDSTYDQVVAFLSNLENSGRVVTINSLRFSAANTEEKAGIYETTYVISSPYVKVETSAVTDDPIKFDMANKQFQDLMARLKALKIYEISIDEVIDIQNLPQGEPDEEPTPAQPGATQGAETSFGPQAEVQVEQPPVLTQ